LRVETEEQAQREQRHDGAHLANTEVRHPGVVAARLTRERALERPQQVERGEYHADGADDRVRTLDDERADQRQELADESREAGEPDRRERGGEEQAPEQRYRLPETAEVVDRERVPALVDDADEEEERAGGQPVADHREDAALDALGREGEDAHHRE